MKTTKHIPKRHWETLLSVFLTCLFCLLAICSNAQEITKPKGVLTPKSVYTSIPDGYTRIGNTMLYYRQTSNSIDIIGEYESNYYSSTYHNNGYKVAMQVGDNSAISVDCLNGTLSNGVQFTPTIEAQGNLARINYTISNTNVEDVTISLGIHADVMIGNNDSAPITKRIDTLGNTYGLTMMNGNGTQLCVLFGSGLSGVTAIDDFWFGHYSTNSSASAMVGNYSSGSNYMVENGSYDSGMGWCWKSRNIPAGSTITFSYLIGVGEVNLEPNSSFEVTPDDPDGWNDLSRPHVLTLNGTYESPAGIGGIIEYAVEDSGNWVALTDTLESGDDFTASLIATFDQSKAVHTINFRTQDLVGNTSLLHPIEYIDVNSLTITGIENKTYTGDSIYQTNISCEVDSSYITLKKYQNNINAGSASFNIEGVFPITIGRKTFNFTINPAPLTGNVIFKSDSIVYNGKPQMPEWQFSQEADSILVNDIDYTTEWNSNILPGEATLTITGIGNYSGEIIGTFIINKANLTEDLYTITLPESDITYDENSHGASIVKSEGVGDAVFSYIKQGESQASTERPTEPGNYDIYIEISEGSLYHGLNNSYIGSFTIFQFDETEWELIQSINTKLSQSGWTNPWDLSAGIKTASSLSGLTIEEGHVIGVDLKNCGLSGSFPIEILSLPKLQTLDLSENDISCNIEEVLASSAQMPNASAIITSMDLSGNNISGNISPFANSFPNLVTLNASHNKISDVYPALNSNITNVDLTYQEIEQAIEINLSGDLLALLPLIPSLCTYTNNDYTNFNLIAEQDNGDVEIAVTVGQDYAYMNVVSDNNVYYKENRAEIKFISTNPISYGSALTAKLIFSAGDVNFTGNVDILDLQSSIGYIFNEYNTSKPYNFTAANLFNDNTINVQDIVNEVNLLLANDSTSVIKTNSYTRKKELPQANIYWEGGNLILYTSVPVAAIDIIVTNANDIEWNTASLGLTSSVKNVNGLSHSVIYSLTGNTIPIGETILATTHRPSNSESVIRATLSDTNAEKITTEINTRNFSSVDVLEHTTGIEYSIIGNKIILNTYQDLTNVSYSICGIDGIVWANGSIANIVAGGEVTLAEVLDIPCNFAIITITADNGINVTKKITLNN